MTNSQGESTHTGRANTVLVFNQGEDSIAVITSIVVRAVTKRDKNRLLFAGPAAFSRKTANHIAGVILPAADIIFKALNLPQKCFEISVVNLGVASLMDVGITISGYSVDVPIFTAMLSAELQMAIPENVISTGQAVSCSEKQIGSNFHLSRHRSRRFSGIIVPSAEISDRRCSCKS